MNQGIEKVFKLMLYFLKEIVVQIYRTTPTQKIYLIKVFYSGWFKNICDIFTAIVTRKEVVQTLLLNLLQISMLIF